MTASITCTTPFVALRSFCVKNAELSRLAATLMTPFLKTCVAIISASPFAVLCTSHEIPFAYKVRPGMICRRKMAPKTSLSFKTSDNVSRGIRSNASSVGAKSVNGPSEIMKKNIYRIFHKMQFYCTQPVGCWS